MQRSSRLRTLAVGSAFALAGGAALPILLLGAGIVGIVGSVAGGIAAIGSYLGFQFKANKALTDEQKTYKQELRSKNQFKDNKTKIADLGKTHDDLTQESKKRFRRGFAASFFSILSMAGAIATLFLLATPIAPIALLAASITSYLYSEVQMNKATATHSKKNAAAQVYSEAVQEKLEPTTTKRANEKGLEKQIENLKSTIKDKDTKYKNLYKAHENIKDKYESEIKNLKEAQEARLKAKNDLISENFFNRYANNEIKNQQMEERKTNEDNDAINQTLDEIRTENLQEQQRIPS